MSMDGLPMLDSEGALPAQPKKARSLLWVTLSAVALASVGIVGFSLRPRVYTVHRLQHVQKKIQSMASRILEGEEKVSVSVGTLFMEEGAGKPSAMTASATLRQEMDAETSRPAWIVTFAAKPGKGADLLRQFKNVKRGAVEFEENMNGDDASSMLEKALTIEEGAIDEVVIKVEAPADEREEEMSAEMAEAISEISPEFNFEVKTGRTIGEMFELEEVPLPLLPGGVEVTGEAVVSASMADMMEDQMGPSPEVMALRTLKKFSLHEETIYRKNSAEYLSMMFPSLIDAEFEVKHMVKQIPASIRDSLAGLDDFADGVKALKLVGLPHKFMLDFSFENFHIAPVLKTVVSMVEE